MCLYCTGRSRIFLQCYLPRLWAIRCRQQDTKRQSLPRTYLKKQGSQRTDIVVNRGNRESTRAEMSKRRKQSELRSYTRGGTSCPIT